MPNAQAHDPERAGRILLAEDDDAMRRLIARMLRRDGHDVIEAADGTALLERVASFIMQSPDGRALDLIISDIRMPWISGLDILAGLRHADWATPVILITAFGDEATHAEGARLGAAAVLDKPFNLQDLRVLARRLVA